jgi:hypothetical protein
MKIYCSRLDIQRRGELQGTSGRKYLESDGALVRESVCMVISGATSTGISERTTFDG